MQLSQAEMDLMRYGFDGGGDYHGVVELMPDTCDQCDCEICECEERNAE